MCHSVRIFVLIRITFLNFNPQLRSIRHEQSDSSLNDEKFLILTQITLQSTRNPKIVSMKKMTMIVVRQIRKDFGGFKRKRHNFDIRT